MNNNKNMLSKLIYIALVLMILFVPLILGVLFHDTGFWELQLLITIVLIIMTIILFMPLDRKKWKSEGRYTLAFPMTQYIIYIYSIVVGSIYSFIDGKIYGLSVEDLFNRHLFFSVGFVIIGVIGLCGIKSYRIVIHRMITSTLIILFSGIIINHNINDDMFVTVSAFIEAISSFVFGIVLSDKKIVEYLKKRCRKS